MAKICQTFAQAKALENSSGPRCDRLQSVPIRLRRSAVTLALSLLSCLTATVCHAQSHDVICRDGAGDFDTEFHTGVKVHVGAARNGELATRVCEATLTWTNQNLVIMAAAAQLDVDAFGVDLGLAVPVVAFQAKKSAPECCMVYKIYSLRTPPVLLRTITGGEFFSAADTDLDGRVEIWTDDAASVEGFENLLLSDLDFAPPMVLRFVRGQLLDVSSEFQPYFDQKIAEERAKLNPQDLGDFKSSDGRLAATATFPADRLFHLRRVKVKVLEIVWSYLYSGREIHAKIFDATTIVAATPGVTPKDVTPQLEITPPKPILMQRPPPLTAYELGLAQSESNLKLVIDSAGKVRSAEMLGNGQVDEGLMGSTSKWKFIPAFSADQPVASRIFLGVTLKR